ncbi:uncharacterized protein [Spinacia oleracea]|uniref:Retrotransposon gag domain-containing protein n=1 Tax=Spinacia oleracea TaxID=3562 RepID=A0A9R0JGE7_SPIOL|nr:uncharacterized protein LOC110805163 [Spinacia oleracea]
MTTNVAWSPLRHHDGMEATDSTHPQEEITRSFTKVDPRIGQDETFFLENDEKELSPVPHEKSQISDKVLDSSSSLRTIHSLETLSHHVREEFPRRQMKSVHHIQQGIPHARQGYISPFCASIMSAPREPKVKAPLMDAYDGTSDPDMHLIAYRHHMYVQGTNEASWCKYFPATLRGAATKWFERLPSESITYFGEMEALFSSQFMVHKEENKTSMHLRRLQQGSDETLWSCVKTNNMEAGQIPDFPDKATLNNFVRGLNKGSFKFDLIKKNVKTMADALDEAEAFIHATEIYSHPHDKKIIGLSESSKYNSGNFTNPSSNIWALSEEMTGLRGLKRERQTEGSMIEYNTDLDTIITKEGSRLQLERAVPIWTPIEDRSPELFCKFHEEIGHDTQDYRKLKKALDNFVARGYLK